MSVPNIQLLRKQLKELAADEASEQYAGDCAYHEGYSDGRSDMAREILSEFFDKEDSE